MQPWGIEWFGPKNGRFTGKSFSEALILATTNPQYDKLLFIDLPVLHEISKIRTCVLKLVWMPKKAPQKSPNQFMDTTCSLM